MKHLFLPFFLFATLTGMAQNSVPFDKELFADNKDAFKEARRNLREGDAIFDKQDKAYLNRAIPFYLKASEFNPDNAELNFKLGVSYLHSPKKAVCLDYFLKSFALDPAYDVRNIHYLLGRGYHLNSDWDDASREYRVQRGVLERIKAPAEEFERIDKLLGEVENGKVLTQNEERVWIDNLGPEINSKAPEYAPLISTDERLMILTARRDENVGGRIDESDGLPYEDLYMSQRQEGKWLPVAGLGWDVNTPDHDASSGLSPDGKTLFVFQGSQGGGDIYYSKRKGKEWDIPRSLGKTVNTPYHESAAALSFDGKLLYFVSERPGGFGGRDIYACSWDAENEEWGEARNLGPNVNSPYDEDGVYIHPDGKTLYFSSKGHNTMGGNDIFRSDKKGGVWSEPVNIGYPINTPDDDVFFIVAADGRTAYYASIRENGYGDKDIYKITFLGPEKEPVINIEDRLIAGSERRMPGIVSQPAVKIRSSKMALLKGRVVDGKTGEPLLASIELYDNKTSLLLATFGTEKETGEYLVSLPAGRNYGLNISVDGYLFSSLNFNLPDSATYREFNKVIELNKVEVGKAVVLRNVFFDFDKATLRPESQAELDRLYDVLVENPEMRVEISGHTDADGPEAYNLILSEERASSVVRYLMAMGIENDRLRARGYGESTPIASNATAEGRSENRRTEFTVIE